MSTSIAPALAADREAELLGVEDAGGAARSEVSHQRLGDQPREILLQHQAVREAVDEPRELAEPDHPAARDVADMGDAARRQEVMRAHRVEVDPGHRHEAAGGRRDRLGEDLRGVLRVSVDEVGRPGLRHPPRRVGEIAARANLGRQLERVEERLDRGSEVGVAARPARRTASHEGPGR